MPPSPLARARDRAVWVEDWKRKRESDKRRNANANWLVADVG
jgi:hypothetical protein